MATSIECLAGISSLNLTWGQVNIIFFRQRARQTLELLNCRSALFRGCILSMAHCDMRRVRSLVPRTAHYK